MARLFQIVQFFDNNGDPLSAGNLYTYEAGTSTPKTTWKDEAKGAAHANPIILDGDGRPPGGAIFIEGSYKFIWKNFDESITFPTIDDINEYDSYNFVGLNASVADLNSTITTAKPLGGVPPLVYTILLSDRGKTLMINALTNNATINLPDAATVGDTFKVWIKKIDVSLNTVTIVPFGSQTLDGTDSTNSFVLYDYNDFTELRSDGSNWFLGGSLIRGTIKSINSDTTVYLADNGLMYNCDTSSGSFNITLPACATVSRGFTIGFKKIDSSVNQVNLIPNGSELIDGIGIYFIHTQWQFTQIKTDGNDWYVVTESNSSAEFVTSDVKITLNKDQNGWVWMNDGTIGDATSGATTRPNADTKALFIYIWDHVIDAWAPVYDSGGGKVARGANAEADFNAHRRIQLLKALGRFIVQQGNNGLGNNFVIGQQGGKANETPSEATMHNHAHDVLVDTGGGNGQAIATASSQTIGVIPKSTNAAVAKGGNQPFSVINPYVALYYIMKL